MLGWDQEASEAIKPPTMLRILEASLTSASGWVGGFSDHQDKWLLAGLVHHLEVPDGAAAAGDLLLEEVGDVVDAEGSLLDGDGVVLGQLHIFLNVATG